MWRVTKLVHWHTLYPAFALFWMNQVSAKNLSSIRSDFATHEREMEHAVLLEKG